MPELPEPALYSVIELNFRRLLLSTERQLEMTSTSSGDGSRPGISAVKLRHFVDTLKDQLFDLKNADPPLEQSMYELYDAHVKALAAKLPAMQLPAYCKNLNARANPQGAPGGHASHVHVGRIPMPRPTGGLPTTDDTAGASGVQAFSLHGLSAAAQERLMQHTALQDLLTDELLDMTSQLKKNTYSMQDAVAQRGTLLDRTEKVLDDSLANAKISTTKAKEQYKRSGGNLCLTLLVIMVVGLVFSTMVVYIKFTHLLGHRAPKLTQAASMGVTAQQHADAHAGAWGAGRQVHAYAGGAGTGWQEHGEL